MHAESPPGLAALTALWDLIVSLPEDDATYAQSCRAAAELLGDRWRRAWQEHRSLAAAPVATADHHRAALTALMEICHAWQSEIERRYSSLLDALAGEGDAPDRLSETMLITLAGDLLSAEWRIARARGLTGPAVVVAMPGRRIAGEGAS